jgi:hypothetical protein
MSHSRRIVATGGFQDGQTAKARLGLPCAVTPRGDVATVLRLCSSRLSCSAGDENNAKMVGTLAMDAFANMVDFFPGKLSRMCRRRFALFRFSPCALNSSLFIFIYLTLDPLFAFSRNFQRIPIRDFRYFRFGKQVARNLRAT